MRVAVIGGGQAGQVMGRRIAMAGYTIDAVTCRRAARAEEAVRFIGGGRALTDPRAASQDADLVLVTVPDGAIQDVAAGLNLSSRTWILHCCGALGADILRASGGRCGAVHPLRSFAIPSLAVEQFPGTFCAVDGEETMFLEDWVRKIGGVPFRVRTEDKCLYHAGAIFASNYLVACLEAAMRLLTASGVANRDALAALSGLAQGTVSNVARVGVSSALSGPVERGDVATVERHVQALSEKASSLAELYRMLGLMTIEVAQAKGTLSAVGAERIREALS